METMTDKTMTMSQCLPKYHLVTSSGEAGDVGGEDQGQDAHVGEHFSAQVVGELVVRLK